MVYKIKNNGLCSVINADFCATRWHHLNMSNAFDEFTCANEWEHMCFAHRNSLIEADVSRHRNKLFTILWINVAINVYRNSCAKKCDYGGDEWKLIKWTIVRIGIYSYFGTLADSMNFNRAVPTNAADYLHLSSSLTICAHNNHTHTRSSFGLSFRCHAHNLFLDRKKKLAKSPNPIYNYFLAQNILIKKPE